MKCGIMKTVPLGFLKWIESVRSLFLEKGVKEFRRKKPDDQRSGIRTI
jgi:hypothetical protein